MSSRGSPSISVTIPIHRDGGEDPPLRVAVKVQSQSPCLVWYPVDADQIVISINHVTTSISYFSSFAYPNIYIFKPKATPGSTTGGLWGCLRPLRFLSSLGLWRALTHGLPPAIRQGDASALKDTRHFSGHHGHFHSDSQDATYKCPFS